MCRDDQDFDDVSRLFTSKTPNEIVFGWNDTQLEELSRIAPDGVPIVSPWYQGILGPNISSLEDCENYMDPLGNPLSGFPPMCNVSTIRTGQDDINQVGQFYKWETMDYLEIQPSSISTDLEYCYETPFANHIWGTSGLSFQPFIDQDDPPTLVAWVPQIWRRVPLINYNQSTLDYNGVNLLKYTMPIDGVENMTANPDNAPYNLTTTGLQDQTRQWVRADLWKEEEEKK